ncbi:DUF4177 domain-containing protein, partial [Dysosmobacter welbionis]
CRQDHDGGPGLRGLRQPGGDRGVFDWSGGQRSGFHRRHRHRPHGVLHGPQAGGGRRYWPQHR